MSLGSVSFDKQLLLDQAKLKPNAKWITLFDDPNDDLYDGTFEEDDPETPMIQVWFKKAEEVSKIVKTTTTVITTTITERNSAWSVQTLRTDMRSKFSELVDGLKKEQQSYFQEEEDRIKTLSTLEQAHDELKGEHANDLADGKKISERQGEFKADLQKR